MNNNTTMATRVAAKAAQVSNAPVTAQSTQGVKLTKDMDLPSMIRAMEPELKAALPKQIGVDKFIRLCLSCLNTTPLLKECSPVSVLSAMLSCAQLSLEPNTPLGQAYLIPYKSKNGYQCQLIIGYAGLIYLATKSGVIASIEAHEVYGNDYFEYSYGTDGTLIHRPSLSHEGDEVIAYYGLAKLNSGVTVYQVMTAQEIQAFAQEHSKGYASGSSPWTTSPHAMACKTVIRKLLKYIPMGDLGRAIASSDCSVKTEISDDMTLIQNEAEEFTEESVTDGAEYYEEGGIAI